MRRAARVVPRKLEKGKAVMLALLALLAAAPAYAQECGPIMHTAIIDLHLPRLAPPDVWDAPYALDGKDVAFTTGVADAGGTVTVAGRVTPHGADAKTGVLTLMRLDLRGRVEMQSAPAQLAAAVPAKMIAAADGYLLLSTLTGQAQLTWFNKDGSVRKTQAVGDPGFDDTAAALVAAPDGGFAIAVNGKNRDTPMRGIILRYTASGALQWRRSYAPGIANIIEGLTPAARNGFVATGSLALDDGRNAGWAMQTYGNGAIMWEQTWPRGGNAALRAAIATKDVTYIAGDSSPSGGGASALWLLAVDNGGDILWQRYSRHPGFAFTAVAATLLPDGRLQVLTNGKMVTANTGTRDHARLLFLSPRGMLLQDDGYIEGDGATAFDLTTTPDGNDAITATLSARMVPLNIEMMPRGFQAVEPAKAAAQAPARGWVIIAKPPAAPADPCTHG